MGLDITHGCWHGAYGAFARWRTKIAEAAGFGNLDDYQGHGGSKPWPTHPLTPLLHHSDCDGQIALKHLKPMADALETLMPSLLTAGDGGGHIGSYAAKTQTFIDGLKSAIEAGEPIDFG